jgi:ABC-type Na+ transport system ATPase subunit NatA
VIVLLHKGRVLFSGRAPSLIERTQADSLRQAFLRLVDGTGRGT